MDNELTFKIEELPHPKMILYTDTDSIEITTLIEAEAVLRSLNSLIRRMKSPSIKKKAVRK